MRTSALLVAAALHGMLAAVAATTTVMPITTYRNQELDIDTKMSASIHGRKYGTSDSLGPKMLFGAQTGPAAPLKANDSSVSGVYGQAYAFRLTYSAFNTNTTGRGTLTLEVDTNTSPTTFESVVVTGNNSAQATLYSVLQFNYRGAVGSGSGSVNTATTKLTNLRINGVSPSSSPTDSVGSDAKTLSFYVSPASATTVITGTLTFTWANALDLNARPSLTIGFGNGKCDDPTQFFSNMDICACPGSATATLASGRKRCVCSSTGSPPVSGACNSAGPAPAKCLAAPGNSTMMSQASSTDPKKATVPGKARFVDSVFSSSGLTVTARTYSNGLRAAEFTWGRANSSTAGSCKAAYTQTFVGGVYTNRSWAQGSRLAGAAFTYSSSSAASASTWEQMSYALIDLTTPVSELSECGFTALPASDPRAMAGYATLQNQLCGTFRYSECYSNAWGFVDVETSATTCYDVLVRLPQSVTAVSTTSMVDTVRVDMRFGSKTNSADGPVGPGSSWKTALDFKTIVQYPYVIDSLTVASVDDTTAWATLSRQATPDASAPACTTAAQYVAFSLAESNAAGFTDTGNLTGNSYCLQAFSLPDTAAYVSTATASSSGACDANQVDQFVVTVAGKCQATIGSTSVSCAADPTFLFSTVVSVPRVCVNTIGLPASSFPTALTLSSDPSGAASTVVFSPGSQLCGTMTIIPTAPIDVDFLRGFSISEVAVSYTSQRPVPDTVVTLVVPPAAYSLSAVSLPGGAGWSSGFCMLVNASTVPSLLHSPSGSADRSDPASNGISIFRRTYTIRTTATFTMPTRMLRTRVLQQAQPSITKSDASATFEYVEPVVMTSSSSAGQQGSDSFSTQAAAGGKEAPAGDGHSSILIGVAAAAGCVAMVALVAAAVVLRRRRAA